MLWGRSRTRQWRSRVPQLRPSMAKKINIFKKKDFPFKAWFKQKEMPEALVWVHIALCDEYVCVLRLCLLSAKQTFLLGCIRVQAAWLMQKGQRRDDVMAHAAFTCELSLAVYCSVSVWLMYWGTAILVTQHCSLTLISPYVSLLFLPDLIRSTFVLSPCLWSHKWTLVPMTMWRK